MPVEQGVKLAYNYGLGIALSIFIAVTGYLILMFVLKENAKREERLSGIIETNLTSLAETIKRANDYQREEHNRMMQILADVHAEVKVR